MFKRVLTLLRDSKADLQVIRHDAVGTSAEVAKIRGNDPARSAKAMVIQFKEKGQTRYRLAVLPGSAQLDFDALKEILGSKVSLVADVERLTECPKGTVPPFSFWDNIPLLLDQRIADIATWPPVPAVLGDVDDRSGKYIFFNAGALDRSIALNVEDYLRITRPQMASFSKVSPTAAAAAATAFAPGSVSAEPKEEVKAELAEACGGAGASV